MSRVQFIKDMHGLFKTQNGYFKKNGQKEVRLGIS